MGNKLEITPCSRLLPQPLFASKSACVVPVLRHEYGHRHDGKLGPRPWIASRAASEAFQEEAAWFILQGKNRSNGFRTYCMKTWNPFTNTRYEALSYLPPLTEESMVKEVDFILSKGWVPCPEFDKAGRIHRSNSRVPGYYDGRYWTLWKLPLFGCAGPAEVLREADECRREYPDAYVRLIAFDSSRQCQCMSFVIHKPSHSPSPASPVAAAAPA